MKEIKILGPGCPRCWQTERIVRHVVEAMGVEARVEKVDDVKEIMTYQVLDPPAVVIDGEVKITGRIPSAAEIQSLLS